MKLHAVIAVLGVSVSAVGCATTGQHQAPVQLAKANCAGLQDIDSQVAEIYSPARVQKVTPMHKAHQPKVRADQRRRYVAGAHLYVAAPREMNEGYAERLLSCHAAGGTTDAAHASDPLRTAGVADVDVAASGTSFRITVHGSDRRAGKTILQRARTFGDSQVQVEQLASDADSHRF